MNIDTSKVRANLDKILDSKLDPNCISTLKALCNYNEEQKFKQLHFLISLLRSIDDNDSVYCITELLRIESFLNYYIGDVSRGLPESREEDTTIREYIIWFLNNQSTNKLKNTRIAIKSVQVSTPIKLSSKILYDWLSYDKEGDLRRYVCEISK